MFISIEVLFSASGELGTLSLHFSKMRVEAPFRQNRKLWSEGTKLLQAKEANSDAVVINLVEDVSQQVAMLIFLLM